MQTISIEEQVINTYHDNISYLQEHQIQLYKKILDFEAALDNGHYKERYELEYKDEGYFDVKEIETGKYFYNSNSNIYAQKAKDIVNFRKDESTFETFFDYDLSDEQLEREDKEENIASSALYGYGKIMAYTKKAVSKNSHMVDIKKFIFFGVGLGVHMEEIAKKVKAENYLIVEDDLELFRLSLFVTNYKQLAQTARLFFVVFEDQDSAKGIFSQFLKKSFYFNHYIKYFQMQSSDDSMVKLMQTSIASQSHLTYLYNSYFQLHLRAVKYLKDGYNFLNVSAKDFSDTFLDRPVILLAAGPSLGKNLDWLEKNRDRFVVVALTATLKILEKRGIKPDIVTHLDPFEKTCMVHLDGVQSKEFYSDSILFCGSQTPEVLIDRFKKENVFIAQVSTYYKKELGTLDPICVGSFTYMVLTLLGARSVYTLGLDLALDSKTHSSHSKDHAYNKKLDTSKVDQVEESVSYLGAVLKTEGNFRDQVLTTLTFDKSIQVIKLFSKNYKREFQKFYNLSDGALLGGLEPKKIEDIKIDKLKPIKKEKLQLSLLKELMKKSSSHISEDELDSMSKRLDYVKELKTKIEKSKYPNSFNPRLYQSQLLGLTLDIIDGYEIEAVDLHNAYFSYLHFIMPFIFDMLNTKELKSHKRNIKKIHPMIIRYCLEIAEYYEKHIEEFFEEELVY
jgi:hypothetical protein